MFSLICVEKLISHDRGTTVCIALHSSFCIVVVSPVPVPCIAMLIASSSMRLALDSDLAAMIDFIVCIGGDGTILYTSTLFPKYVPPCVCFNMGSLGFVRVVLKRFRSSFSLQFALISLTSSHHSTLMISEQPSTK